MARGGFHSIAKLRAQIRNALLVDRSVCYRENCRTTDCYSQRTEFESGMPKAGTAHRVRIRPESGVWQSAVHLRANCQAVILIVANRGIRARKQKSEIQSAPFYIERPLFGMSYIFEARLYKFKTNTRSIVLGLNWKPFVSVGTLSRDIIPLTAVFSVYYITLQTNLLPIFRSEITY
jgi:hypothetical protein